MAFGYRTFVSAPGDYYGEPCGEWRCEECDRDEYGCVCAPESVAYPMPRMTYEEALAKIAEVFTPNILQLEARKIGPDHWEVAA